jgi:hypothetical protein
MVRSHSLLVISSAKEAENKKAMGDIEAAHGLPYSVQLFIAASGRLPPLFLPSTTNSFSS